MAYLTGKFVDDGDKCDNICNGIVIAIERVEGNLQWRWGSHVLQAHHPHYVQRVPCTARKRGRHCCRAHEAGSIALQFLCNPCHHCNENDTTEFSFFHHFLSMAIVKNWVTWRTAHDAEWPASIVYWHWTVDVNPAQWLRTHQLQRCRPFIDFFCAEMDEKQSGMEQGKNK